MLTQACDDRQNRATQDRSVGLTHRIHCALLWRCQQWTSYRGCMMNERDNIPYQEYSYTRPYEEHTRQPGGANLSLSLSRRKQIYKVRPLNYKRVDPLSSRDTITHAVTRIKAILWSTLHCTKAKAWTSIIHVSQFLVWIHVIHHSEWVRACIPHRTKIYFPPGF